MKFKLVVPFTFASLALVLSGPVSAHHGQAKYDANEITLTGTVTEFQFSNPHAEVYFEVKDSRGNFEKWIGEASSPNMLVRDGWSRNSLRPGDRISASGHPAKNGSNNIYLEKLVLPNGRSLAPHPRWPA
jgi:hypothetical protein